MMAPPQRPSDAPTAIAKPGETRENSMAVIALIMASRVGAASPSPPAVPAFSRSSILASACRAMSARPKVAMSLRIGS